MKREKICFFKNGKFPLVSESHITNKIANIKINVPIILCKELNTAQEAKTYLRKISHIKKYHFINEKNTTSGKNINKPTKFKKELLISFIKITGIHKLLRYHELLAPEFLVWLGIKSMRMRESIKAALRNNHTRHNFYLDIIIKEKIKYINCCYGWEIIEFSMIKDKLPHIKTVVSIRGKDLSIYEKYKCIREISKKYSDILLTRSKYMRDKLIQLGFDKNKVKVNHSGCDLSLFHMEKKGTMKELKIISVGRLVEKKDHITLIRACSILQKKKIPFALKIIGEGPEEKKILAEIKKENLDGNIEIIKKVENNRIPEYFRNANVFILPSIIAKNTDSEGIPVSLMEAMASGLLCISTRTVGIPELIENGKNGFLVNEKEPEKIANILCKIRELDKQSIERITSKAREKIEKEFDSVKQSANLERIISEMQ